MGEGLASRDSTQSLLWYRSLEYFKAAKFTEKKLCQISEMCTDACLDRVSANVYSSQGSCWEKTTLESAFILSVANTGGFIR